MAVPPQVYKYFYIDIFFDTHGTTWHSIVTKTFPFGVFFSILHSMLIFSLTHRELLDKVYSLVSWKVGTPLLNLHIKGNNYAQNEVNYGSECPLFVGYYVVSVHEKIIGYSPMYIL